MRATLPRFAVAMAVGCITMSGVAVASPIVSLPDLQSIDVFEQTTALFDHNFMPGSAALTTRLADPLSASNNDFSTGANEFYDVYYSDANGLFDTNGAYVTADVLYSNPADSGGNINEMRLNFTSSSQFGNVVTHCVTNGPLGDPGTCARAADGDLSTWSNLGNTDARVSRLSVTVGFDASAPSVPEPCTMALLGSGLAGIVSLRRRARPNPRAC